MKAYRLKITLKESKPPIWRRIEVPANMSFEQLSEIIIQLFGFEGYHLSEFEFPDETWIMRKQQDDMSRSDIRIMARHSLEEFEKYKKFKYTYDFGDNWTFQILQEAVISDYPHNCATLIKYKGNNLVEDVGGIWGYYELLQAWNDPEQADGELLEWAGPKEIYDFEPESAEMMLEMFTAPEDGSFAVREGADEEDLKSGDDSYRYFYEEPEAWDGGTQFDPDELAEIMEMLMSGKLPETEEQLSMLLAFSGMQTAAETIHDISEALSVSTDVLIDALNRTDDEKESLRSFINAISFSQNS